MLISIFLEDLPQLVLQAMYFAKSRREIGWMNGTSIFMTVINLVVSIAMSRVFIKNFFYTYIRPNENLVGDLTGNFKNEMWKLGTLLLLFATAFDMAAAWCFYGLVLEAPDSTVQADFEASGTDYFEYKSAYIAVAVLQTIFAAPVRIITCIRLYSLNTVEAGLEIETEKKRALEAAKEKEADNAAGFAGFGNADAGLNETVFQKITAGLT